MESVRIKVKPNAKKQAVQTTKNGSFTVYLKSPPIDGKANEKLIKLLAKKFDVSKSSIKSGFSSRNKLVEINPE